MKRLYIVTGKGGVGKTTVSLALAKKLSEVNPEKKIRFISFNRELPTEIFQKTNIEQIDISLEESTEIYIGKKLNSQTIASWIMKTPFFKALYNMLPSLGQMVTLGHILDLLKNDPDLIIVLDSPASGHALSMFESTHNFRNIFGQGPIVRDIEKMHELLYDPSFLKVLILSLPTEMATQESVELKDYLIKLKFEETQILINDCLSYSPEIENQEQLPEFLKQKVNLENEVLSQNDLNALNKLPHIFTSDEAEVVKGLVQYIGSAQ